MDFLSAFILTVLLFYCTIRVVKKMERRFINKTKYRQSDVLLASKSININEIEKKQKISQSSKRLQLNAINVVVVDNTAYWVVDNIFYSGMFSNNEVDPSTAKPVNTENMSKEDVEKMLYILDKLRDENKNDSGSSR